jgi:hypothetical protein
MKTLTPNMVPPDVAARVLAQLNARPDPSALWSRVGLLGEDETGINIAAALLAHGEHGFNTLNEVLAAPGLGAARFTELVLALGVDVVPFVPRISQSDQQPSDPRISASETELEFKYDLTKAGFNGIGGTIICRACSRCSAFAPGLNSQLNTYEAQVEITGLVLSGEDEHVKAAIEMDERMKPYDWMHPLDAGAKEFQFPAKMQLNNSMIIKTEIKSTGERLSLVSRDVPCQAGRVINWPPYGVRLHSQREINYVDAREPLGPPVLRIGDATTYLTGPGYFFLHRPDIIEYRYIPAGGIRDLPAVELKWKPMPSGLPTTEMHDHYHVYRSQDPDLGEGSWVNVSGCVHGPEWVDPNPPAGPLYYRVACVTVTILGDDYEAPYGQVKRVEPAVSVFRV